MKGWRWAILLALCLALTGCKQTERYRSVAWSPDSQRLAFVQDSGLGAELYVARPGHRATKLHVPGRPTWVTWRSDGQLEVDTIYYRSTRHLQVDVDSHQTTEIALPDRHRIDAPDARSQALYTHTGRLWVRTPQQGWTSVTPPGQSARYPTWSPDSNRLFYWVPTSTQYVESLWLFTPGTAPRTLYSGYQYGALWSPDSRFIVVAEPGKLVALDVQDGHETQLMQAEVPFCLGFDASGRVLVQRYDGHWTISAVPLQNPAVHDNLSLTTVGFPTLSPDHRHMALIDGDKLLVFDTDGTHRLEVDHSIALPPWARWILIIAGVVVGLRILQYLLLMHQLLRQVYSPQGMSVQTGLPATETAVFTVLQTRLHSLGFEPLAFVHISPHAACLEPTLALIMRSPDGHSTAIVRIAVDPSPALPCDVSFVSFFGDGTWLETLNGLAHAILGVGGGNLVVDEYVPTIQSHWQVHRQALERRGRVALRLSPEDFATAWSTSSERDYHYLERTGTVSRHPDGFQLTLGGAWRLTRNVVTGSGRRAQWRRTAVGQSEPGLSTAQAMAVYRNFEHAQLGGRTRRQSAMLMFLITLVLGALSFTPWFSGQTLIVVVGVLIFHELGHLLAMQVRGYRNPHIFFVPFLGAATMGQKDDVTINDQAIVLLAGPVPGILLAAALLAHQPAHPGMLVTEIMFWLCLLNLLNLAPLSPLDGGRLVAALLSARFPRVDVWLQGLACVLLVILGIRFEDPLLTTLGAFMGLVTFGTRRLVAHAVSVRQHLSKHGGDDILPAILQCMVKPGSRTSFGRSFAIMRDVRRRLLQGRTSGWTLAAWTAAYLAVVTGGVALFVALLR